MTEFEEFAAAELPRLLGLSFALTGNPHDAWDLTQETLLRVGSRWSRVADGNPGGYARTTLVRLNVDRLRRWRRERPGDGAEPPVFLEEPLDAELLAALGQLPRQQRAAVALRFLDDLDHATIARHLGCSEVTARTHVSRGLARLRDLMVMEVPHDR